MSFINDTIEGAMNRPTIADLARAAGVSISTVNRLLHGSSAVRQDTIDQILKAAQEIGFYGLGTIKDRRREALPHYRLGFLLQQSHRPLYRLWGEGIVAAAHQRLESVIEPDVVLRTIFHRRPFPPIS